MTTTAPGGDDNGPSCSADQVEISVESLDNGRNSPIVDDEDSGPSILLPNKRKDSFLAKLRRRFTISAGPRRKTSLDSSLPGSGSYADRKVSAGVISSSKSHEPGGSGGDRKYSSFFRRSLKVMSRKSAASKGSTGGGASAENGAHAASSMSPDAKRGAGADEAAESSAPIPVASGPEEGAVRVHATTTGSTDQVAIEANGDASVESAPRPVVQSPPEPFVATPEFLQQLNRLFDYPWYWGPLTSSEATTLLETQIDGAFLIRDSEKDCNRVSLSFKSGGRTLHCRIEYQEGLFRFFEGEGFGTITELIENAIVKSRDSIYCYSRSPNSDSTSYSVRLTSPILRTAEPRTLQYLCRFRIRRFARAEKSRLPVPPHLKPWLESRNLRF